jgi:predicted RNase H-like HicB family nuclease
MEKRTRRKIMIDHPSGRYTGIFIKEVDGGYCGVIQELPGAITYGKTIEEACENMEEAISMTLRYSPYEPRGTRHNQVQGVFEKVSREELQKIYPDIPEQTFPAATDIVI